MRKSDLDMATMMMQITAPAGSHRKTELKKPGLHRNSALHRNSSKQVLETDSWVKSEVLKLCKTNRLSSIDTLAGTIREIESGKNRHFSFSSSASKWNKAELNKLAAKLCK